MISDPQPFTVELSDQVLGALEARLRSARWPGVIGDDDWVYGVPQAWLQDMTEWWIEAWDWPAEAERMNQWQHHRVVIDDIPIHYLHAPGKGPNPTPLLLTHGWPWTFWDFKDTIGPLSDPASHGGDPADAFDVYVVSLPGFGFSTPLTTAGVDVAKVADLWVKLMCDVLGHERFAAHGGDWGALVTSHLAHAHADRLVGAHLSLTLMPGVDRRSLGDDAWGPDETWKRERNAESESVIRSHVTVHLLDPQTLSYGLVDSPVGTAAWIWERRRNWSDCNGDVETAFDRQHLCTTAALYWCTGAISSSLRLYHEHFRKPWPLAHDRMPRLEAPTGWAVFPKDVVHMPRSVLESHSNLHRYTEMPAGGHFGAPEQPELLVGDIRAFFAPLR